MIENEIIEGSRIVEIGESENKLFFKDNLGLWYSVDKDFVHKTDPENVEVKA